MKSTPSTSAEKRSLADTHIEGFVFLIPPEVQLGQGCVLQIFPACAQAEMYCLSSRRTLIGREPSCDITIDDDAVSRSHAAIEFDDSCYRIVDLGSRNGTFIDDRLLRDRTPLRGGEHIRLGGTILKFMASMNEEAQYHATVQELMTRDPLTNAYNRGYLTSSLQKLLPRCQSMKHSLSVIMLDIDHFKNVNDSYGHLAGDEVLRVFTERVRNAVRPNDVLCRAGGEEFVVIAERTELADAVRMAERIRLTVSSTPFTSQAGLISVTCSLGVTTFDESTTCTVDELLARADELMYAAKNNGRNMVRSALNQ